MSSKQIEITVAPDGSVTIDAKNFTGNSCALATRELELVLSGSGAADVSDKKKPDFYNTRTGIQTQKN